MSSKGQVVIPQTVRKRCKFGAGDHFVIEDDPEHQAITLRKVRGHKEWFSVYMQCPGSFEIPPRKKQFYRPTDGLVG